MPRRRRVVYVEDNAANLLLVRRVLEADGSFEVLGAADAKAGLALLEQARPAALLLDLDLPGMSGIDLLRQIRRQPEHQRLPVLVITASVMKRERNLAFEAGCDAFIEKPFDIKYLRDVVHQMCGAITVEGDAPSSVR